MIQSRRLKNGVIYNLKRRTIKKWFRINRLISCLDCGAVALKGCDLKDQLAILNQDGWHFHLLKQDRVKFNLIDDAGFRCHECFEDFFKREMEKDHGHIRKLNYENSLGGDVFSLKPYSSAYGMGRI